MHSRSIRENKILYHNDYKINKKGIIVVIIWEDSTVEEKNVPSLSFTAHLETPCGFGNKLCQLVQGELGQRVRLNELRYLSQETR